MARERIIYPIPEMFETWEKWALKMIEIFEKPEYNSPLSPPSIPFSRLPTAKEPGQMVWVPDETGGAILCYSDGTTWRRVHDNVVAS